MSQVNEVLPFIHCVRREHTAFELLGARVKNTKHVSLSPETVMHAWVSLGGHYHSHHCRDRRFLLLLLLLCERRCRREMGQVAHVRLAPHRHVGDVTVPISSISVVATRTVAAAHRGIVAAAHRGIIAAQHRGTVATGHPITNNQSVQEQFRQEQEKRQSVC
jgi:hypothetical protein